MPSMARASSPACSGLFASFTPPPLPRPPAWICAFTTATGLLPLISSRAAATASSAEVTSFPRGTETPNLRRISFAWYSWIFIEAPAWRAPQITPRQRGAQANQSDERRHTICENDVVLRTASEALDLLRRERVLTVTPAPGVRSLVGEIAGNVRGSWWGHPQGGLIYSIATALEDSPEVLSGKLVRGKVAFVHRALWPTIARVVLDSAWRRGAEKGLSTPAKQLLAEVERKGTLRLDGRAPARLELEKRGLLLATSEHTPSGRHAVVLRSWRDWTPAEVRKAARALDLEAARDELRAAGVTI